MEQSVSIVYTHTLKYKLRPFLTGSSGDSSLMVITFIHESPPEHLSLCLSV